MCYRTKLTAKAPEIEKTFDARFLDPDPYQPMGEVNAFNFSRTPVITDQQGEEIQLFTWGLIPFWVQDDSIKKMTLNAKIETLTQKPAFRNSVKNRCLVIADGYYEWQWKDPKGRSKQKYLITPKDQEIFAFAGIYSSWENSLTQQRVHTYTILTTAANELMSRIHNHKQRMPVVLKKEDHQHWLSGMEVGKFALPYEVPLRAVTLE